MVRAVALTAMSWVATGFAAAWGQQPGDGVPAAQGGRRAVVIVPVWDPPACLSDSRDQVARPGEIVDLSVNPDASVSRRSRPLRLDPGSDYRLLMESQPNPLCPALHYHVYEVDLNNPSAARNWRELRRAQRDQLREEYWDRRNEREMQRRKTRLLGQHAEALETGRAALRAGEYRRAVLALTLAGELNNADPACRIHLAQARMALGHDEDAAKALRRALQLQPKLIPLQLGLEEFYPQEKDFADQVDGLARRLSEKPAASADEYLLLGFMEFQRGRIDQAYAAFKRAAQGSPRDRLIHAYLDLTKPAAVNSSSRER